MEKKLQEIFETVKKYSQIDGMSRFEEPVVDQLKAAVLDSNLMYERDGMGSVIFSQKEKPQEGPVIQIAAHMDEVGFIVQDITDKGQLRLSMIGGVWPLTVIGTKAIVYAANGKKYEGVFGHTSIHILEVEKRTKAPELKELYVDLGFKTKEEVVAAGIEVADPVYLTGDVFLMNQKYVVGKAIDNRAGVAILEILMKRLKAKKLANKVYFVGTTQEEVGTRGARTSVQKIKPQIAIAIDTCAAHDTMGAISGIQELGLGAALRIKDGDTLMDPNLVKYLMDLAKQHNIKAYKYVAQGGGTDAAELQFGNDGVATITISIPQRYLHSPLGVAHLEDLAAVIDLVEQFILKMNQSDYEKILKYQ